MKTLKGIALALVCFASLAAQSANADITPQQASYELRGTTTYLYDFDVDYYAPPILVHRTKNTYPLHEVQFNVLRYEATCVAWQQVCTAYDQHGRCVRWENQCVQWGYRQYQVEKHIQLDFRDLAAATATTDEVYELQINRMKPAGGNGEDWVTTAFSPVSTTVPVKIQRWSDFNYVVQPK